MDSQQSLQNTPLPENRSCLNEPYLFYVSAETYSQETTEHLEKAQAKNFSSQIKKNYLKFNLKIHMQKYFNKLNFY